MTTMKRWECPRCGDGKLAPSRPRKDDTRRYCLTCSDKTGRLVERVAPSLERKREEAKLRAAEKAKMRTAKRRAAIRQDDLNTSFRCGLDARGIIGWRPRGKVIEVRQTTSLRSPRLDGRVIILYDHDGCDAHDARAMTVCALLRLAYRCDRARLRANVEKTLHVRPRLDGPEERAWIEVANLLRSTAAVEKLGHNTLGRMSA